MTINSIGMISDAQKGMFSDAQKGACMRGRPAAHQRVAPRAMLPMRMTSSSKRGVVKNQSM